MKMLSAEHVTRKPTPAEAVALLRTGARMDQKSFHGIYLLTPEKFKAELIGGEVYVASPVSAHHGLPHARLIGLMFLYMQSTPGLDVYDNTTTILGEVSEPQPDAAIAIQQACGGQSRIDKEGYIEGTPELVAEIAHSSAAIDLGKKKHDYERAGTGEYLVLLVKEQELKWFIRREDGFELLAPSASGVYKSEAIPGFWLSAKTFYQPRIGPGVALLNRGLASPEHKAFVAKLKSRHKKYLAAQAKRKGK